MPEKTHEIVENFINSLIQGQIVEEKELDRVLDHVVECKICLSKLALVSHLINGVSSKLTELLEADIEHEECLALLPEYIEEDEVSAKLRYPGVWRHLQQCHKCSEHQSALRNLFNAADEIGSAPLVIWKEKSVTKPVPARKRRRSFTMDRVIEILQSGAETLIRGVLPPIMHEQVVAVALDDSSHTQKRDDFRIPLPESIGDMEIKVSHINEYFYLAVIPHISPLSKVGNVMLALLQLKEDSLKLIRESSVNNEESVSFPRILGGVYRLQLQCTIDGNDLEYNMSVNLT